MEHSIYMEMRMFWMKRSSIEAANGEGLGMDVGANGRECAVVQALKGVEKEERDGGGGRWQQRRRSEGRRHSEVRGRGGGHKPLKGDGLGNNIKGGGEWGLESEVGKDKEERPLW